MPPTGGKEIVLTSDVHILPHLQASEDVPSTGASGGDRPGQVRCHQLSAVGRFQLKVQRGAGEALWCHR